MKLLQNWTERALYGQFFAGFQNITVMPWLKCIISANLLLPIHKLVSENFSYRFDGPLKWLPFLLFIFDFDDFLTAFAKNLMSRPPVFMIDIKSFYKLLLFHKDLKSRNFWQWNSGPLNIFKNWYGNAFSLLFSLNEKIIVMCHLMTI